MTQNILYWICNCWILIKNIGVKPRKVHALMGTEYGIQITYARFFPLNVHKIENLSKYMCVIEGLCHF
jgi:hypothetical protein